MAITITKVTGIGGNPPTHLRVEGTVTGCEIVQLVSSCTSNPVQVPIPTGGFNTWTVDLPNDKQCSCGTSIKITAWCSLGEPDASSITIKLPIDCNGCPIVTITADPPGLCINGKRSIIFHATLHGVPATGVVLQWSFPGSTRLSTTAFLVTNNGPLPDEIVEYVTNSTNAVTRTASLQIISPANCPTVSVAVVIEPCQPCCPSLTLSQPAVSGCAPGSTVASFAAVLTWPAGCTPLTPTSYEWTLNGPSGKRDQRSTRQPYIDTRTPWIDVTTFNAAMVQFASGGSYSISVTAVIPGVALPCNPTDTRAFSIADCCPQLIGPLNGSPKTDDPCT